MTINSLKDLEAVIKLCRRTGVQSITVDNVVLALGDAPEKTQKLKTESKEQDAPAVSDEELLFWSSQDPMAGSL